MQRMLSRSAWHICSVFVRPASSAACSSAALAAARKAEKAKHTNPEAQNEVEMAEAAVAEAQRVIAAAEGKLIHARDHANVCREAVKHKIEYEKNT